MKRRYVTIPENRVIKVSCRASVDQIKYRRVIFKIFEVDVPDSVQYAKSIVIWKPELVTSR